jgi:hypothetical protein
MQEHAMTAPTDTSSLHDSPTVDQHTPARAALQRVRNTLRLNAFTSLLGGLAAAVPAGLTDRALGTHHSGWVRVVGLGLVLFAIDVATIAGARASRLLRWTPVIIAADIARVFASIATIVAGWYSTSGAIVVGALAVIVGSFAARQFVTHRRAKRATADVIAAIDESPPIEVAHVERALTATLDRAWAVVTDHELYGRLAPNLGSVHATMPNGPGLQRTCTNRVLKIG